MLSGSSCLSLGGVQRADTLGKGNFQIGIEPGAWGLVSSAGSVFLPTVDFSGRYGIAERVDLGLRLGSTGLEFQSKFLLSEPGSPTFAMSLAPTFGGFFLGSINYAALNVPLLLGFKFGDNELTLGPRMIAQFLFGGTSAGSAGGAVVAPGASVGFAWQVAERFALIPELTFAVPVVGVLAASGATTTGGAVGAVIPAVQFKLGLAFGKVRARQIDDVLNAPPPPPLDQPLPPPPPPMGPNAPTPPPMPPPSN